jgi:hypothetical protein
MLIYFRFASLGFAPYKSKMSVNHSIVLEAATLYTSARRRQCRLIERKDKPSSYHLGTGASASSRSGGLFAISKEKDVSVSWTQSSGLAHYHSQNTTPGAS